jgi:hypothetical protein
MNGRGMGGCELCALRSGACCDALYDLFSFTFVLGYGDLNIAFLPTMSSAYLVNSMPRLSTAQTVPMFFCVPSLL